MTDPSDAWAGSPRSRALTWSLDAVAAVVLATVLVLSYRDGGWSSVLADAAKGASLLVANVALGTLLALRQPANPVGWLLIAGGCNGLASNLARGVATQVLARDPADTAGRIAASFAEQMWPLGLVCSIGLPLLLFPAGRARSARWRWVIRLMVASCALILLAGPFSTMRVANPQDGAETLVSPLAIPRLAPVTDAVIGLGVVILMATILAAVVGIIVGFRHSTGTRRQQLRWVFAGAALASCGILTFFIGAPLGLPPGTISVIGGLGLACFPLSFAIAILRYRLYDLDRIISRTVSYGVVTGLLIAVYVGLVTGVSRLIPDNSKSLAVAGSTLAVAALLQPLLRRVRAVVDRRFNRSRYDATRTVEAFTVRLREQVDLGALQGELLAVVHQTMQPSSAGLWLRGSGVQS